MTRAPVFNKRERITHDQLEAQRIALENNLQQQRFSVELSLSAPTSSASHDDSDVEYPRHAPKSQTHGFRSFEYPTASAGDVMDLDGDISGVHGGMSYARTDPDDDYDGAISPFASTAAHHASALTLTAGLRRGQGYGHSRDVSLSGAEFDPDRPLSNILGGAADVRWSMLDGASKSKSAAAAIDFDPMVVDADGADTSSALDRILRSGSQIPPRSGAQMPPSSPPCDSSSASSSSASPRLKLADALNPLAFSPKRPRSYSPLPPVGDDATPRPPRRPQVNVHPPTPDASTASRFTKMTRGLARELRDAEASAAPLESTPAPKSKSAQNRNARPPFAELSNAPRRKAGEGASQVQLPDVTGLTSAVASPARVRDQGYQVYQGADTGELEERLLATLQAVHNQLSVLAGQNARAAQRVGALEQELELCRAEVRRTRPRDPEAGRHHKGKGRDDADRYQSAVEDKKALESIVATLRTHLSRLTSEMSEHQDMLAELRRARDADAATRAKDVRRVEALKAEVSRLAGEVEVLQGIVDDRLRQRRRAKVESVVDSDEEEADQRRYQHRHEPDPEPEPEPEPAPDMEDEDEEPQETFPRIRPGRADRTNYATVGSDPRAGSEMHAESREQYQDNRFASEDLEPSRFISADEVSRIQAELEERRSQVSPSAADEEEQSPSVHSVSLEVSHDEDDEGDDQYEGAVEYHAEPSVERFRSFSRPGTPVSLSGTSLRPRPPSPERPSRLARERRGPTSAGRPAAPTPRTAASRRREKDMDADPADAPFPRIRGEHLERLFFAAPEHDSHTCTACNRRRRVRHPERHAHRQNGACVEEEGEEDDVFQRARNAMRDNHRTQKDELPPQTVLARVLRELEDDFTHYKSIYIELAEQYALLDAASNVPKRNVLAQHLREVIDVLEQKGDQIASLYDLLQVKDKPVAQSVVPPRPQHRHS